MNLKINIFNIQHPSEAQTESVLKVFIYARVMTIATFWCVAFLPWIDLEEVQHAAFTV